MKLKGSKNLNQQQLQDNIDGSLNYVHFSKELEPEYRLQYCEGAAYEFRYRGAIILALYLFLSFGIYQTLSSHPIVMAWLKMYVWVGIIIAIAWVFSFIPRLNRYFDLYSCFGSMASVALTFIIVANINAEIENILVHTSMMYAIVIIYALVGMRFYNALIAGWAGGLIGVLVCHLLDLNISWTVLNRTYTFSSFLGMALAYATDRQSRANYLQHCLIQLSQEKLVKQSEQLELLSQIDALTGLANRRYLTETLDQHWRYALRHGLPLSILMIDLDYFKNYNDHCGHLAGDECLQTVAKSLKSMSSRSGELAARYGGEEFMIVLPMTNLHKLKKNVEFLLSKIRSLQIPHPKSPISPHITISIGAISLVPASSDDLRDFIHLADQALYQAKARGRNQYYIAALESESITAS